MAQKTPAGEMTAPELRKLIRAHNILSKITIPKGTDRNGLIKLIEGKNYKIDHKNKVIKPQVKRGKQITLKQAEELTKPKPVSEEVKKARAEKKKEQEEEKKKDIKVAKKEAVQEFKKKQKEAKKEIKKAEKLNAVNDLKIKSISNNKKDMGETAFIKQQKKLQLQKQKETRRALLKSKVEVDKTTRRGKPVKKKELTLAEKKEKIKQLEKEAIELEKNKEVKKDTPAFTGINIINTGKDKDNNIKVKNTKEVIDFINSTFNIEKQLTKSQIDKIDSLFKLTDENPKYVNSMNISENRGSDPSPYDEGNVYIEPYYRQHGTNEVPTNKIPFKYIKLKGERKPNEKKKTKKQEILKSEKKPEVKKPAGKGGNAINKLTGPEAEELWEKLNKLMPHSEGYARDSEGNKQFIDIPYAGNLKERKDLFKFFTSDKLPDREITKEEYEKLQTYVKSYSGLRSLYTEKITGVEKKEPKSYDKATWKFTKDKDKYMLLPQFFSDTIYGKKITKWDMKKVRQIIEDYLKGDIGTKKKEVKKLEVKDFIIILKGKNYNKEEFLKWVDNRGYKFSKQQLEKLNFLVVSYRLQSFRNYYNSNGVLVLVPTLKFNASTKVYNPETKQYEVLGIGEVLSEISGERGGSVLKLELKPKEKIDLTPEKIKEYDMTRLQFNKEELPALKKTKEDTKEKLEVYEKEYKDLYYKEASDKSFGAPFGSFNPAKGVKVVDELQTLKALNWFYRTETKGYGSERTETKTYVPQSIRDWYDKNVKEIQKLNLVYSNVYNTINSYETKTAQIKKKYNIE
jgi:hypothetical protein